MSPSISNARNNPVGTHIVRQCTQILIDESQVKETFALGFKLQAKPGFDRMLTCVLSEICQ